jgi:hypothetical protein
LNNSIENRSDKSNLILGRLPLSWRWKAAPSRHKLESRFGYLRREVLLEDLKKKQEARYSMAGLAARKQSQRDIV